MKQFVMIIGAAAAFVCLSACDRAGSDAADSTQPAALSASATIEKFAATTQRADVRAAMLQLAKSGSPADQQLFLDGKSTLDLADEVEIGGDARPPVTGGASCKPRGCKVRLICRPKGDNPCDSGDIDVSCDTPC